MFQIWRKSCYFALRKNLICSSGLKTRFSGSSYHLGILNAQEHRPTPTELGDRGLRTLRVDHKSQFSFVKYNGGGLRNVGNVTDLELTAALGDDESEWADFQVNVVKPVRHPSSVSLDWISADLPLGRKPIYGPSTRCR